MKEPPQEGQVLHPLNPTMAVEVAAEAAAPKEAENGVSGGGKEYADRLSERVSRALDHQDLSTVLRAALELGETEGGGHESVLLALDRCVEQDSREIELLCRRNCSDFVEIIDELAGLRQEADSLRDYIEKHCDFVERKTEPELKLMKDLSCCIEEVESKHDERMDLERKCQTLELLWQSEKGHGQALEGFAAVERNLVAYSEGGKEKGLFEGWLASAVAGARQRLLARSQEDFNRWLLEARTRQAEVARRKVARAGRRAAWASRHRSAQRRTLRRVREDWGLPLGEIVSRAADAMAAESEPAADPSNPFEEDSSPPPDDGAENTEDFGLDLAGLHRCRHAHRRLGLGAQFAENYRAQRQMQLRSDLEQKGKSGGGNFAEECEDALHRALGFVIIEDRVSRTADDLVSAEDVAGYWQEALESLTSRMDGFSQEGQGFLSQCASVCSKVALCCTVAQHYGLDCGPLLHFNERATEAYAAALQTESTEWVAAICKDDLARKLRPVAARPEGRGEEAEWRLDHPAGVQPYSCCVPEVTNLTLSLLQGALELLTGTKVAADLVLPLAYFEDDEERDDVREIAISLVTYVVLPQLKLMVQDERNDLKEATQMMANVYFGFIPAFHGLETYVDELCRSGGDQTLAARRMREESQLALSSVLESPECVSKRRGEGARALPKPILEELYQVMDLSEENVLEILCAKCDSYSANYVMMDWCPQDLGSLVVEPGTAPGAGQPSCRESECAREVASFVGKMAKDSESRMPKYLHRHLFSQVFKHTADHVLQLLSCSAVSRFNLVSIVQLKADMAHLTALARKTLQDDDVDILFAGLVQVLEYLLSCAPESILDSGVRQSLYPQVQLAQLGRLLRKYQETSKDHPALNSLPFLGNQPSKQAVAALAEKIQALP